MSSNPPTFNFGPTAPSTSASSTPGLFGSSNPPGSSLFGAGGTKPPGSNLFGGADAGKAAGGGFSFAGFGSSNTSENTSSSSGATGDTKPGGAFAGFAAASSNPFSAGLGGSQTPSKPSPFLGDSKGMSGNVSSSGMASPVPAGSTTPGTSGFSFKPSTTPAGPPPTNLFGTSTGGNNLFGNKNTEKSSSNPFQIAAAAAATGTTRPSTSGGGLFGGDQTKRPPPTSAWGKTTENSQGTSPATTTTAESQKSLFGGLNLSTPGTSLSIAPSTEAQKPLFGGLGLNTSKSPASPAPPPSAAPSLFFQPPVSSVGSDKTKPFMFPSVTPTNATTPTDGQNLKQASNTNSSQASATSAPTFSNLFNRTPTTSSATPSGNLFNLGVNTPATSSSTTPSANVFSLGVNNPASSASQPPALSTAATATTSAPFSSLFKVPEKPTSATTTGPSQSATSQPTTASTAVPTSTSKPDAANSHLGTSLLGASTSGPTPPTQSRLRNKTMDEILTRWASDLTKYTKEFQTQAETIAHWDQLLVENMSKISKLYISAVTAEKQTASVEMQLSAVENQQHELESWLTKYEGEVEEMLTKNGAGQGQGGMESELGGPDQERERTYRLAEKLGERLEDMGRDLGTMIEEVNVANAGLSKTTNADEPITQIVRILNSHLSQLQAIDQDTVALQAKVNAAQKASQGLGFSSLSGSHSVGAAAVDDFYRSYMGRR